MERKGSANETKRNCSELDESSTLITIESLNEQKFIEKLVQKYNTLSDRVWIGLEWNDNTFKWMDGSDVSYENWDENAVKNGINKCVQMSISNSDLGNWTDDVCTRKYLMACQKKQASKNNMQKDLSNLTRIIGSHQSRLESLEAGKLKLDQDIISENNIIESHGSRLDSLDSDRNSMKADRSSLKDSSMPSQNNFQIDLNNHQSRLRSIEKAIIPIGFLYTQLPNQSSPQQLWPSLQWTEVTQQYAGLFFRAEGSGSLPFGQTQPSNQSWISNIWTWSNNADNENGGYPLDIGLKEGEWTKLYPGSKFQYRPMFYYLKFYTTSAEVRPKNTAIKIWKRVK